MDHLCVFVSWFLQAAITDIKLRQDANLSGS